MRKLIIILFVSCCLHAAAQKIDKEAVYPVFQDIKVKWPKDGYSLPKISFDECVTGDCNGGEGGRLTVTALKFEEYGYYFYYSFLKGRFSNAGKNFVGNVYKSRVRYTCDDHKTMKPSGKYDLTDTAFLSSVFIGNGAYKIDGYLTGWHGEAMPVAFAKKFPGATIRNASFANRNVQWLDIDLPQGNRFTRYTGRVQVTGDYISGKAVMPNGDSYEGFFLKNMFFGPGKFTKKNGKTRQGIWQQDSLLVETAIEFPAYLFEKDLPARAPTTYSFRMEVNGEIQSNPDFYGTVENEVVNGWGLAAFNWGTGNFGGKGLAYGLWKNNKLEGPGILITTPVAYDVFFSPGRLAGNFWIKSGIFKEGKLIQGSNLSSIYDTYPNEKLNEDDIQNLYLKNIFLSAGSFENNSLRGCGLFLKSYTIENDGKFSAVALETKEGFFTNEGISGFYFENDFAHTRNLEKLKFPASYKITEKDLQAAEASNNFCFDVMRTLKPQYIAAIKKQLARDVAAVEEAKKPAPPFNPFAHLQPETPIEATEADYAKVDWEAIGEKRARAGKATRESIHFWESVSADVRKYLGQTYQVNGNTYKRYTRCRYFSPKDFYHGSHEIQVTGKKTSFIILHYCERTGSDAKANVAIQYEGKKVEGNQFVSGGKCEFVTQCSTGNICKTQCPGAFEFDQYRNAFYGLFLNHEGNWSGAREYWIVLKDEANTK